jgi:hypothetical protein
MTRKLTTLLAAAAILGGLTTVRTVFAEEAHPSPQCPRTQGMMVDGGMMNMMGQMSTDQMKQMTRMLDSCNRMMESVSNAPAGPDHQPAPDNHK